MNSKLHHGDAVAPGLASERRTPVLAGSAVGLALAAPATAPQPTPAAKSLVFDSVTVVDVEHGKLMSNQRVVIASTRIQTMRAVGEVKLPKNAQVVAAQGKYLIPGLWDRHAHTGGSIADWLYLANGITGIRRRGGHDKDV